MAGKTVAEESSAEERAERLWNVLRPAVVEAVRKNSPRAGIKFDEIEESSAAAGDALARLLMEEGVLSFPAATDAELEEAKQEALKKADPNLAARFKPEELRVVRMRQERTLKTMRGPVRCRREYLYFPDVNVGLFPPR